MDVAGSNVRTVRTQLGMSLRALAEAAGLDSGTLSRIENGKQNLTEALAAKLAKAMGVSQGMLFAEPGLLEVSMLHMRKVPVLKPSQLKAWRGPDAFEEPEDQIYVHAAIETGSRYMFALHTTDTANAPEIRINDLLIYDAQRDARMGDIVIAQNEDESIVIGRCRILSAYPGIQPLFDIVPRDRLYPVVKCIQQPAYKLRGVLAEQRRTFKPSR